MEFTNSNIDHRLCCSVYICTNKLPFTFWNSPKWLLLLLLLLLCCITTFELQQVNKWKNLVEQSSLQAYAMKCTEWNFICRTFPHMCTVWIWNQILNGLHNVQYKQVSIICCHCYSLYYCIHRLIEFWNVNRSIFSIRLEISAMSVPVYIEQF